MGKAKFKINKTVKREIFIAVDGLPPYPSGVSKITAVKGSTLLKKGYETAGGVAINPNETYRHLAPVLVDHYKRGIEEYRQGGVLALTAYVVAALEFGKKIGHEPSKKAIEDAVNSN